MELTERKVKKLPWQATGILLMHQAGFNPALHMNRNTYYAYKRLLKTHGFDIQEPRKNAKTLAKK